MEDVKTLHQLLRQYNNDLEEVLLHVHAQLRDLVICKDYMLIYTTLIGQYNAIARQLNTFHGTTIFKLRKLQLA